jgi:D-alanine-D-alanine ligase
MHIGVLFGDPRLPYAYSPTGAFGDEEHRAIADVKEAFESLPQFRVSYFDDHETLLRELPEKRPDLVLNLCDTGYRNRWELELTIPAYLELLDIPYTGADPAAIVRSNDKAVVSTTARLRGVLVPEELFVDLRSEPFPTPERYPALVKPNVSCGSAGVTERSLVHDATEAEATMRWLRDELDVGEALVQQFLPGAEYTVGCLGNAALPGEPSDFEVLPPLEVDFGKLDPSLPKILTHASKAEPDSPYWKDVAFRRAEITDDTMATITEACRRLCISLGLRDYARIDFRCDADGVPHLLDANVNPTWVKGGKLATMASWVGHDYPGMIRTILETAMRRVGLEG